MEGIFGFLFKDKKIGGIKIFSVEEAEKYSRGNVDDREKLQNGIVVVDFSKRESFTDPNPASMCVEVFTSDGIIGTLSHLQTGVNVGEWADKLTSLHNGPCPVCLAGGEAESGQDLSQRIESELTQRGFSIGDTDIGGLSISRQSILYRDHVLVQHSPNLSKKSFLTLKFNK